MVYSPFKTSTGRKQGHGLNGGPGDVIFKCCAKNSLHLMTWIGASVQKTQMHEEFVHVWLEVTCRRVLSPDQFYSYFILGPLVLCCNRFKIPDLSCCPKPPPSEELQFPKHSLLCSLAHWASSSPTWFLSNAVHCQNGLFTLVHVRSLILSLCSEVSVPRIPINYGNIVGNEQRVTVRKKWIRTL